MDGWWVPPRTPHLTACSPPVRPALHPLIWHQPAVRAPHPVSQLTTVSYRTATSSLGRCAQVLFEPKLSNYVEPLPTVQPRLPAVEEGEARPAAGHPRAPP